MKRIFSLIALMAAAPLAAQTAPPPGMGPRARGPSTVLSLEAAEGALRACAAKGYHVTAAVVDSAGVQIVSLSDDGAVELSIAFALRKAAAVIQYRMSSGELAEKAKADPALAAEVKANPKIGFAMAGALPVMAGGEQIGAIAVSGAAGPAVDEECARAGLAEVAGRLR
jgi:uncharacterized protein GlcG (DUF336 family)